MQDSSRDQIAVEAAVDFALQNRERLISYIQAIATDTVGDKGPPPSRHPARATARCCPRKPPQKAAPESRPRKPQKGRHAPLAASAHSPARLLNSVVQAGHSPHRCRPRRKRSTRTSSRMGCCR